jgi:hypothetical protein
MELNMQRILVETDCQELVKLWKSRTENRAAILPVLKHIQELSEAFSSFDLCFVRRTANVAAHITAKKASPMYSNCTWPLQVPVFLASCIQHDSNHAV